MMPKYVLDQVDQLLMTALGHKPPVRIPSQVAEPGQVPANNLPGTVSVMDRTSSRNDLYAGQKMRKPQVAGRGGGFYNQ